MSSFSTPVRALVRPVSRGYARCLRVDASVPIDVAAARRQHEGYVDALRSAGVAVAFVDADDDAPDACFVEDTAVITGRHALATRPGAPSRRGEVAAVARALAPFCRVEEMEGPSTLDGGDVLRVGSVFFVGLSTRTNEAGAARLGEVAAKDGAAVRALRVAGGLHLKSACTLADERTLLYDPALLSGEALAPFAAAGLSCVAAPEPAGANVLALGGLVLVSAAAPATAALLEERGLAVRRVDVGEMHKGDGALTCLSLRLPAEGAWCA